MSMDYKSLIENGQELHHHGVKGMKWGKRAARAVGEFGKQAGIGYVNTYLHPLHTISAGNKVAFRNGKAGLKYAVIAGGPVGLGYRNKIVKDRVAAKKIYKEDKKNVKALYTLDKDKDTYKTAKYIIKRRYKKRLREAGGTLKDYKEQYNKSR